MSTISLSNAAAMTLAKAQSPIAFIRAHMPTIRPAVTLQAKQPLKSQPAAISTSGSYSQSLFSKFRSAQAFLSEKKLALNTALLAGTIALTGCERPDRNPIFGFGFKSRGPIIDPIFAFVNIPPAQAMLGKAAISASIIAAILFAGKKNSSGITPGIITSILLNVFPGGLIDAYLLNEVNYWTPDEIKYIHPLLWGITTLASTAGGKYFGRFLKKL